jgi:hypothetical protein
LTACRIVNMSHCEHVAMHNPRHTHTHARSNRIESARVSFCTGVDDDDDDAVATFNATEKERQSERYTSTYIES